MQTMELVVRDTLGAKAYEPETPAYEPEKMLPSTIRDRFIRDKLIGELTSKDLDGQPQDFPDRADTPEPAPHTNDAMDVDSIFGPATSFASTAALFEPGSPISPFIHTRENTPLGSRASTPGFPTPTPHTSQENSPEQEESPASSYGRVVHMPPKVIDWNNWPRKNYHPEDYGSYSIDYLDEIDRNREWLYVSPYPLRISQTLIDPVSVDPLADPVNSRIIPCPHHLKIESNFSDLFNGCAACDNKDEHVHKSIKWIMDSGASKAFTSQISDFSDLIYYAPGNELKVSTANGWATIVAYGTVFIETKPLGKSHFLRLHPVYLLPGMTARLMSMGQVLRSKLCIYGDENTLTFMHAESNEIVLLAKSNLIHENIFWVDTQIITGQSLTALNAINDDSYDLWHQRLGHPSDQVLIKFKTKTRNFPSNLTIPHNPPICEGCAKGKMRSRSFPENPIRATKPFERIHSDLREYPVLSYSKYKYYISFLDDCTSHAWIILLRKKTEALAATEQFLNMVKTQFRASVQEWFSDNGGEYQSDDYLALLKNRGIIIY